MKRIIVQNGMFFKKFVQSDSLSICPDLHVICEGNEAYLHFQEDECSQGHQP